MKIQIKEEYNKQLVQCVYLGNLVINEFRSAGEEKKEYADFLEYVLMQIVDSMPKQEVKFELKVITYEKNKDNMLSDLCDRIEDSINEYYEEFRNALFDETLAQKLKAN